MNGVFHVGRPKTQESARTVDLAAAVVKPLAEYLLRYPPSPDGLIFHGKNGNPIRRKVFRAEPILQIVVLSSLTLRRRDVIRALIGLGFHRPHRGL